MSGARLLPAARPARAARRVPRAPPGRLAGDARRAARRRLGATTRCSCATDGLLVGYLETEDFARAQAAMEATDVNARWQAEMAPFFELPSASARHRSSASTRSSTLPDAPAYARDRPRRVERARGGRAARRTGGSRSRRCTASRTAPCALPDGLRWNLLHLFTEALDGPARAPARCAASASTAWGVDYALLDGARPRARAAVPLPRRPHRRDGRARVRARARRASSTRRPASRRCRSTPSSSCSPTRARAALAAAERIALVPDLLALWLSGELANESTARRPPGCSTRAAATWARELVERLGLPARLFRDVVEPGTRARPAAGPPRRRRRAGLRRRRARHRLGVRRRAGARRARRDPLERHVVPARARAARAGARRRGARGEPDERARRRRHDAAAQERHGPVARAGVRARLGRRRSPSCTGSPPTRRTTSRCSTPTPTSSSRRATCRPGSPTRARAPGQREPRDRGETVRAILVSLACKYRFVLERLEAVAGRDITCIHAIGGGVRNELLCRLTADVTRPRGRRRRRRGDRARQPARPGPRGRRARLARRHARGRRRVDRADHARAVARPRPAEATYRRFLDVTGLATPTTA